ncbi:hypothetical protein [Mycobacterium sp. ITM-2016-00318]|uniref:hypothetical protein n=1 Tax=Mycobacterium sp. ITM-2016-00318 TaxID=2099693 RepID=UPI000CF8EC80|nr:hypothetical protein [Mycobacterium sp. ITM-2016-00318]WNG95013.1 hypothetical protein C6A82_011610 [Mycobacterium sp. ITM-2016-00318]
MSALSGGVAPALAKPDKNDPGIPIIPTPEVVIPEAPQAKPEQQAPVEVPRAPQQPPSPPQVIDAPPQQAPAPQIQAPPEPAAPAPQIAAPAPKKEQPRVVEAPKADVPKVDPPKADAPPVEAPKANAPKVNAPKVDAPPVEAPKVDVPKADVPKVDAPKVEAPNADAPAPLPAVEEPGKPGDPKQDAQLPRNLAPGQTAKGDEQTPGDKQLPAADEPDPSATSKGAQRVAMAAPDTLKAPEQDIQLARQATPIEVKPEPAKKEDIDFLASAVNLQSKNRLGPFESGFNAGSDFSVGGDRVRDLDDRFWDQRVRQWDPDWIEYDRFYRPIIFNPFRAPVRIVYALANATRILVIEPLARVVVDLAEVAAYSFTAVVLGAANVVSDVANVAADVVNVAVGTIFGGGYVPQAGLPFVPPPPLLRYDNVPVQVRYSNATYEPFRVNQIVDVGDDVQYGGRKVLLDGATPAWGQWVTSPAGERQFEVHRTQQYPGLGEPQEAPLPGDYRMQLASGESSDFDRTQMYLIAAGGVVGGLGIGALGLAFYLGRRRLQV